MSLPGSRGLRAAGGMRAAWERQLQAATLAAAAGRILRLAASKPAFFSTQLHAVLAALQHLHHTQQQQDAAAACQRGREEESGGHRCEAESDGGAGWQTGVALAAAAAHLRRLASVDEEAGANAVLLLWLLLELAGRAELLPGGCRAGGCVEWIAVSAGHLGIKRPSGCQGTATGRQACGAMAP